MTTPRNSRPDEIRELSQPVQEPLTARWEVQLHGQGVLVRRSTHFELTEAMAHADSIEGQGFTATIIDRFDKAGGTK